MPEFSETPPHVALCQNCARLIKVADLIPDENDPPGLCPMCNGQTCDCGYCMHIVVDALERGDWESALRKNAKDVIGWTPDGGLITPTQQQKG